MAVDSVPDFKTSATLPPIPGLRFRHFAGPSDYPAMNDAANDAREANGVHNITDPDGFASYYAHLDPDHCALERDLFVVDVDGEMAGYARTEWADEEDARVHYVVAFLRPEFRRQGIGRAMLEALEERAIAVATDHPTDRPVFFTAETLGDPGADALLTGTGYVPVRYHYVMVRPNLHPVPDARMPDGLEIRPVEDDHLRPIFDAGVEAARGLWGYTEPTEADFDWFVTDPIESSDRSLWRIAWDGDQIAGQVRAFINDDENERFGENRGWVEHILVRAPWRRRGLARALIASSIDALRERGMTEGALGVDVDNPSGALRLYESVGFERVSLETAYRKPMPSA
jgi:GNAT superfamily N-acetyltransferase